MRTIFLNLPVTDVAASRAFWAALGLGFNEDYSDASAACLVVEQNVCVMLLSRERFADFVNGSTADPHAATAALYCLTCSDRAEVDDLVARAVAAGAKPWKPVMEQGPMYGHSFQDPDGHVWELMAMAAA